MRISLKENLFNKAYLPFINCQKRYQIYYGGSSSGKSIFRAQAVVYDLLGGKRNYLIIRNVATTLRGSVFTEVTKMITQWGLNHIFKTNKTEMTITCLPTMCQAIFRGLDDVEKLKSITVINGVITDIWVEEATETSENDIEQLEKRLRGLSGVNKRLIFSFNPINQAHWIYKRFFSGRFTDSDTHYEDDDILIHKTTYKDNKFLEKDDIKGLENKDSPTFSQYHYDVYTLGNWGSLGNTVFTNWRVADISDMMNVFDIYKNGMDFGFTNDPTVLLRSARKSNKLYILDGFEGYGMQTPDIAKRARPIIHDERVRCDSAEPRMIAELKNLYNINAIPSIKGSGSINFGIQWIKQHEVIIDKSLQFCVNDFSLYQYRETKDGRVLNEPVDRDNHSPDALRYGWSGVIFEDKPNQKPRMSKSSLGIF